MGGSVVSETVGVSLSRDSVSLRTRTTRQDTRCLGGVSLSHCLTDEVDACKCPACRRLAVAIDRLTDAMGTAPRPLPCAVQWHAPAPVSTSCTDLRIGDGHDRDDGPGCPDRRGDGTVANPADRASSMRKRPPAARGGDRGIDSPKPCLGRRPFQTAERFASFSVHWAAKF